MDKMEMIKAMKDMETEMKDMPVEMVKATYNKMKEMMEEQTMSFNIHDLIAIEDKSREFNTLEEFQAWLNKQIEIEDELISETFGRK